MLSFLAEFSDVMRGELGQTELAEHKTDTGSVCPAKLPPYHQQRSNTSRTNNGTERNNRYFHK